MWPVGRRSAVGRRSLAAGQARAPERIGDRSRVDGLDGRLEQVDLFEEERTLLRVEERKPLVDADLHDVGLDLREVGVQRRVDDRSGIGQPLRIDAELALGRLAVARIAHRAGVGLRRQPRRVGRDDAVPALRQPGDLLDGRRPA
jgi:hypothetical protein